MRREGSLKTMDHMHACSVPGPSGPNPRAVREFTRRYQESDRSLEKRGEGVTQDSRRAGP
jgi:hypothetical protein